MQLPGFQAPNGGYFGSMMTDNGGMGGAAPSAQSFTAPPISQAILAMLSKLGDMGQQQGGSTMGALPPNSFSPFMPNGGQAAPDGQQQQQQKAPGMNAAAGGGLPPGLTPELLQQLLQKIGIGKQQAPAL